MREIKFRAWDTKDKRMIVHEQDFIPLKVVSAGVLKLNPKTEYESWYFVDRDSNRFELMQYTGLKDSTGKEIYEGDIIVFTLVDGFANQKEIIEFRNGSFYPLMISHAELAVIGNIHKNPEML